MAQDFTRSITSRLARLSLLTIAAFLVLTFCFNALLAAHVSPLAVGIFLLSSSAFAPGIHKFLGRLPVLKVGWIRGGMLLAMLSLSNWLLASGDRAPPVERKNTALVGATIITGREDGVVFDDGVVLVDEYGQISAVGTRPETEIPEGFDILDVSGKYLMPGLINAHSHSMMAGDRDPFEPADFSSSGIETPEGVGEWVLRTYPLRRLILALMERNARKALAAGVTTVRELATVEFLDVELRKRIENGIRIGPRVLAAGVPICITGGHAYQIGRVISGPIDARNAVREAIAKGVDAIKITSTGGVSDSRRIGEAGELQMTPEEIRAVVDEAHRKNTLVAAHAESPQGVLEALRAGVDNIEHGASLDDEAIALFLNNPLSLRGYSSLHPTLSVLVGGVVEHSDSAPGSKLEAINTNAKMIRDELFDGYKAAIRNGVHVAVGTDAGVISHDSVWAEMKLFIEHGGVSHERAIYMGTLGTARSIGIEEITGSIEVGKSADILVLTDDPRQNIEAVASPHMVVARGVRY